MHKKKKSNLSLEKVHFSWKFTLKKYFTTIFISRLGDCKKIQLDFVETSKSIFV